MESGMEPPRLLFERSLKRGIVREDFQTPKKRKERNSYIKVMKGGKASGRNPSKSFPERSLFDLSLMNMIRETEKWVRKPIRSKECERKKEETKDSHLAQLKEGREVWNGTCKVIVLQKAEKKDVR